VKEVSIEKEVFLEREMTVVKMASVETELTVEKGPILMEMNSNTSGTGVL